MTNTTKPRYWIGIDPGVKTGMAIWDAEIRELMDVRTMKLHTAADTVRAFYKDYAFAGVVVRFEDARLRKWYGNTGRERLKGAGSVERDCKAWEEFLTDHKIPFEAVAPKDNVTKLNPAQFTKYTGWFRTTSEHGRDAAMLVYGK